MTIEIRNIGQNGNPGYTKPVGAIVGTEYISGQDSAGGQNSTFRVLLSTLADYVIGLLYTYFLGATNVKRLGAVGDGVTDDTAAIQLAFDMKGLIFIPGGRYRVTAPLVIRHDTKVFGVNRGAETGSVIVPVYAGSDYPIKIDGANGSGGWVFNLDIEDIYFEATNWTGTATHFMYITGVYTSCLRRVTVSNPPQSGGARSAIRISKVNHLELDNVRVNMATITKMPVGIDVVSSGLLTDGPINGLFLNHCDVEICTTGVRYSGTAAVTSTVVAHYSEACATYIDWDASNTQSHLTMVGGLLDCEPNSTGIKLRRSNATMLGVVVGNAPLYAIDTAGAASTNAWFVLGGMLAGGVNDPGRTLTLNNTGVINVGGGDRSGTVTFGGVTTATVTFPFPMQNGNYVVALGPSDNRTYWVTSKTASGFTVNASSASSATVDWMIRN